MLDEHAHKIFYQVLCVEPDIILLRKEHIGYTDLIHMEIEI